VTALDLAQSERQDLADLLDTLTPEQWGHETLCAGWTVRDVAAHTVGFEGVPLPGLVKLFVRGRFQTDRINDVAIERLAALSPSEVVAAIRAHSRPTGMNAGLGGRLALTDNMIHHQDIRRPLGMPRVIPVDRLVPALDFVRRSPTIRGAKRTRGVRLIATDLDWSAGDGAEVRGPGEALLMVMAGRRDALRDLVGPGVQGLAARL
jgi:uncharacterized protein (TIGR03083 family)